MYDCFGLLSSFLRKAMHTLFVLFFCLCAIVFVEFLLDKILLFDILLCSFFILVTPNSLGVQVETPGDHPLLVFLFFYSLPEKLI